MRTRAMLILCILSLAACSRPGGSPAPTVGVSATTATPAGSAVESPAASRTIGLDDNGKTLQFVVGDRFALVLGTDFDWTLTPVDESVISRVRNITVVRGGQGVFDVVGRGATTLSATGDPPCRKATPPCGAPSILFQVTISAG